MSAEPDDWSVPEHLRLMWDHTVDWPLWREDGLDFDDPEYIRMVLGLSAPLVRDVREWARQAELLLGNDGAHGLSRKDWEEQLDALDGWAAELVKRLSTEVPAGVPVRYHR